MHTYWDIGRVLHTHFLEHKARAGYGEGVMARLAQDLEMSQRLLYQIVDFYRAFPILQTSAKLGWSHYQILSTIPKPAMRRAYLQTAEEANWSVRELNAAIKTQALEQAKEQVEKEERTDPPPRLEPRYGRFYTYRILPPEQEGPIYLDLGFGIRFAMASDVLEEAGETMVVESMKVGNGGAYEFIAAPADPSRLYTYQALIRKIIDGDTLWVDVDCGFGVWIRQKLRLRDIDTPELSRAAGVRVREFVVAALSVAPAIVLTTSRTDKYDRYIADVFYLPGVSDPEEILRDGIHLNQQLLGGWPSGLSSTHPPTPVPPRTPPLKTTGPPYRGCRRSLRCAK